MALQTQVHIYSVDTSDFYKKRERKIHEKLSKLYVFRNKLKKKLKKEKNSELKTKTNNCLIVTNKSIKYFKKKLCRMLNKNNKIRNLNINYLKTNNIVSIFESTLTRTIQIAENTVSKDLIIVQTYFFEVIEDLILDGFMLDGEKYVCFTASAGQIRTKKTVFIKESIINKYEKTLMCGLTKDIINQKGGININKYLAYLALCNSATDLLADFDITKSIVVDDMELKVKGLVDFIDDKTYKITRVKMKVPIVITDGCGMILPRKNNKNFMIRLPWIKGLLMSFPFDDFIKEHKCNSKVKDIYGKEWDILNDGIEVIFTKSQFKMYKYYESWKEYCDNFIQYNCQAGKCNEEGSLSNDAKIGYQMLQTLTDITDKELRKITKNTRDNIYNVCKDKKTMLRLLGVTKSNRNKNYIQSALEINPSLLMDSYTKNIIEQTKKSLVKEGKSAKLEIQGKYTFISPDLYAFCEYLFLKRKHPKGLLNNGEVYCNLFKDSPKLDCLRSPHLYKEHAVRENIIDKVKNKWFTTSALYTSCHDLISKILQFDNDGDCSLVISDSNFIDIAERNMKNIVPLYYKMAKAGGWIINNKIIYEGLKTAYTGGNIGMISNDITKIWNSGEIDDNKLKAIKLLCMENNFTIDYAKTLYKPERPKEIKKLITSYTKAKVPCFFIYAKDKKKEEVELINESVANRISKMIKNPRVKINISGVDKFDYKLLKNNKVFSEDNKIIELYEKLDLKKFSLMNNKKDIENYTYVYQDIRKQILQLNSDVYYVGDVLIDYLYKTKKAKNKTTLWESFGDILLENLKVNTKIKYMYCNKCGDLLEQTVNNQRYCSICAKEIQKEQKKLWKRDYDASRKAENR